MWRAVLNPDEEDVRDILFARRNDNAEMLEDLHYDQETGLVYVKKIDLAAYDEETNLLTRNDVQAQLMIASESEIIDELIDAGAIQPLEDELFQAAAIQPDEEVTPESVLPEIEGEIRPGDTLHFRATRTNTYLTNQTVNYIWNPGEGAGNDVYFYEALRDGNIASLRRRTGILPPGMRSIRATDNGDRRMPPIPSASNPAIFPASAEIQPWRTGSEVFWDPAEAWI